MTVDKLVIYNDHIEVQRRATKWMTTVMCPHTGQACNPDCLCFGEYVAKAVHYPNEAYVDHTAVELQLLCDDGTLIVCDYRENFADLRRNPNKKER